MVNAAAISLALQFPLCFFRSIGTVSPDIRTRIVRVDQLTQDLAVMHSGIGGMVAADEFVLVVYIHVVLVAVVALVVFLSPAGLRVLLAKLVGVFFPVVRDLPRFDRLVLFPAVTLPGYRGTIVASMI